MKKLLIALVVLGTTMLTSCVREKSFELTPLGENDIAFVMQNSGTRSAEVSSDAVRGVTLKMGTTPGGEPIVLEETIEELNPSPATKGAPAYTKNVGTVHPTMGVYSPRESFGDATFEVMDEDLTYLHDKDVSTSGLGWRYHHIYASSPWPDKKTKVDFYLRMPEKRTTRSESSDITTVESDALTYNDDKSVTFTLKSPETAAQQQDLLFGYAYTSKELHDAKLPNGYPVTMYHALSGVKFANGHENDNQTKTIITKVEFTGLIDNGILTINPTTGATTVEAIEGKNQVTSNFSFSQTFSNPDYVATQGKNNSDGTVDFSKPTPTDPEDENYIAPGEAGYIGPGDPGFVADFSGTSWVAAAEDHNLNNGDGSLTFWFIPQLVSNSVKLKVTFFVKTPDTPDGTEIPLTINFGELVNGVGTDNPKQVEWKAGQLRTYTLKPYDVDVEIKDEMTATVKSDLHIANTGNVDEYVRMLIMGNWYGWKPGTTTAQMTRGNAAYVEPSILVGYKYQTEAAAAAAGGDYYDMVDPWFRGGYKVQTGVDDDGNPVYETSGTDYVYRDPYGTFDSTFLLGSLGDRDGMYGDWADASGGYYYTKKIGPGEGVNTTSATKDLFKSYTVSNVPDIYLPVNNTREKALGVHLVMEIVVQAIAVPKDANGDDVWWLQAWYDATEIDKLNPSEARNEKFKILYEAGEYNPKESGNENGSESSGD